MCHILPERRGWVNRIKSPSETNTAKERSHRSQISQPITKIDFSRKPHNTNSLPNTKTNNEKLIDIQTNLAVLEHFLESKINPTRPITEQNNRKYQTSDFNPDTFHYQE